MIDKRGPLNTEGFLNIVEWALCVVSDHVGSSFVSSI